MRWPLLSEESRWKVLRSNLRYAQAVDAYDRAVHYNHQRYLSERAHFDRRVENHKLAVNLHNARVRELMDASRAGDEEAEWELAKLRLEEFFRRADLFEDDALQVTRQPNSKRVLAEVVLPDKGAIPSEKSVRFLKTTGEHRYSYRSDVETKRLYASLVAQMVLAVLNTAFETVPDAVMETLVINAVVIGPDPATGVASRIPVISVSTHREKFENINLIDVDPISCLKYLSAAVSRNPAEAVPVRPIVNFDMNDPRFVAAEDVLGGLDSRPNLLDLSPSEFESLIQNLFTKMGLDTKQTQASRDGGVDAVAFDHRPVLGGKVIIQAKRYKNRVGVSAVRDLFGAVMNEGASKGILVTTSGYGKASFDFANGKPLELLDGQHLLHLLREHAGIEARIVVPQTWVEPPHQD